MTTHAGLAARIRRALSDLEYVYSHNLNAETVSHLSRRMIDCHPLVKTALESFAGLLDQSQ